MDNEFLARYSLTERCAIHHWLACGPVVSPIAQLSQVVKADGPTFGAGRRWTLNYWAWSAPSKRLKRQLYAHLPHFSWQPSETNPHLHAPAESGKRWEYAAAGEDQVIDFSLFNFTLVFMQGWLFTLLDVDESIEISAELLTIGPARVFLNGKLHTHFADEFSYVALQRVPLVLRLNAGLNALYLHGELFGWREARLALGLRFREAITIQSCLPLGTIQAAQWRRAQAGLEALCVKQFAFPRLPGHVWLGTQAVEPFAFTAEVDLPIPENVFSQLRTLEQAKGETSLTLAPSERGELPIVNEVTAGMSGMPGENSLRLRIRPADGTPLEIHREIWAGSNRFSTEPYGDYEQRRSEALAHLARMPYDVPAAMAALEIGAVDPISSEAVALACHFMENRYDCADFYAVGLLALMYRYGDALKPADRHRIEEAFHGFKFWIDEPGLDAMCYFTENHQILFHVACYLAGQRWRDWVFTNSERTGLQQQRRARPRIEDWILRRLQGNFSEWDSNAYMTLDAFAMLALVEFAESKRVREMATVLLHKIFFLLACQSFRGAHASTHGRCYVTGLKSARVENTSSLQRIAWGMGLFNGETRATGLLALSRNYRVPDVIQRIGADVNSTVITRACSSGQFRPQFDMRGDKWEVRTLTHRTPDVMLSAALDYLPGEDGIQEHLWQATLSPEACVFTTYPGNSQEHGNARPNFWAGSARLPRVGMAGRTVMCLYRLEPGVGLGFTHAYFPTLMFDESVIEGNWAFARCGDGYIALWGDGRLALTEHGRHAAQELRSQGKGEVWICHVGRATLDGDFATFRQRVMARSPHVDRLLTRWETPQGDTLTFGWEGAMRVNGRPENWDEYLHYDNMYTQTPMGAETMTMTHNGQSLTLDLKHGRTSL